MGSWSFQLCCVLLILSCMFVYLVVFNCMVVNVVGLCFLFFQGSISEKLGLLIYIFNLTFILCFPVLVILKLPSITPGEILHYTNSLINTHTYIVLSCLFSTTPVWSRQSSAQKSSFVCFYIVICRVTRWSSFARNARAQTILGNTDWTNPLYQRSDLMGSAGMSLVFLLTINVMTFQSFVK